MWWRGRRFRGYGPWSDLPHGKDQVGGEVGVKVGVGDYLQNCHQIILLN